MHQVRRARFLLHQEAQKCEDLLKDFFAPSGIIGRIGSLPVYWMEYFPISEDYNDDSAIKIFMDCGMWSSDKIRGKISDVTFEDIKITTDYDYKVNFIFNGLDEEHNASNIIFKNITLNGKALTKKDDFNISSNQFVDFKIS